MLGNIKKAIVALRGAIRTLLSKSFGYKGHRNIESGFSATAGEKFFALQIVNEAVLTYVNDLGGDNATAVTYPAGDIIYGEFQASSITVASGYVRGYLI